MAGSADVESMYSSISRGTSSIPYMSLIFCLTDAWYSATRRSASISTTYRLGRTSTSPLPKKFCSQMSDSEAWGSVENSSVRLPCTWLAYQAREELDVVLPSPPLPAKMTISTSGCWSKYAPRQEGRSSGMVHLHAFRRDGQ